MLEAKRSQGSWLFICGEHKNKGEITSTLEHLTSVHSITLDDALDQCVFAQREYKKHMLVAGYV